MKKFSHFSSIVIVLTFILGLSVTAFAIPTVSLEIAPGDIYVGDSFDVNVIANGVTDIDPSWGPDEIISFGFDVDYAPTEFAFNGATVAAPFLDDSASFANTDVAGSAFPGVSGASFGLASLSLTALHEGSFTLGIISDLTDFNEGLGSLLYAALDMTQQMQVDVLASTTGGEPVPEPSTVLLMGIGLLGLVGVKARKRN